MSGVVILARPSANRPENLAPSPLRPSQRSSIHQSETGPSMRWSCRLRLILLPIRTIGRLGPSYCGIDTVNRKARIIFKNLPVAVSSAQICEDRFNLDACTPDDRRATHDRWIAYDLRRNMGRFRNATMISFFPVTPWTPAGQISHAACPFQVLSRIPAKKAARRRPFYSIPLPLPVGSLRRRQLHRLFGVLEGLFPLALVENELIAFGRYFAQLAHHGAGSGRDQPPHDDILLEAV